ncbi:WXG100 family type VII secretion target [Streptomyces sp. IBSBF 2435]|uniref:WXG100 family type VII secretion target n=1 Tax=Streptomyces sp. IBSBF 2435 TaxID=2903531 RepID=UPI002FDC7891
MTEPLLRLTADELTGLANEMSTAEGLLEALERRLTALAETAEACWLSGAASEYHDIHRRVTGDTGTVRRTLAFVREAVELSRDGFSAQDLETLDSFRELHVEPSAPPPHSRVADL